MARYYVLTLLLIVLTGCTKKLSQRASEQKEPEKSDVVLQDNSSQELVLTDRVKAICDPGPISWQAEKADEQVPDWSVETLAGNIGQATVSKLNSLQNEKMKLKLGQCIKLVQEQLNALMSGQLDGQQSEMLAAYGEAQIYYLRLLEEGFLQQQRQQ